MPTSSAYKNLLRLIHCRVQTIYYIEVYIGGCAWVCDLKSDLQTHRPHGLLGFPVDLAQADYQPKHRPADHEFRGTPQELTCRPVSCSARHGMEAKFFSSTETRSTRPEMSSQRTWVFRKNSFNLYEVSKTVLMNFTMGSGRVAEGGIHVL